jgi:hypothetical protein
MSPSRLSLDELLKPPLQDWDSFYEVFTDECRKLWDCEPRGRVPAAITLPDGVFPGVASVMNPITGEQVPVRRVPLVVTEADDGVAC